MVRLRQFTTAPVVKRLLTFGVVATAMAGASATPAVADTDPAGHSGTLREICATDLYVRKTASPTGAYDGTLYRGEHFLAEYTTNGMWYGWAYGSINRHGYVVAGYFC